MRPRILTPRLLFPLLSVLTLACAPRSEEEVGPTAKAASSESLPTAAVAEDLAHRLLIVDTHIDVPYRLEKRDADLSTRTEDGDFDHPRARKGGLDVAFMSIYVPASYQETGGAYDFANRLIDKVEGYATRWPDKFVIARSTADVERHFAAGLVSLPMGMENGAPIEGDLGKLRHFADRGIRYVTLTHSRNNHICDSSYEEEKKWGGLSPFGREVVAEMNRLGMMIDVSHVSDEAFYEVVELSRQPVIASHSSCRHFTPNWERNMSDDMIRALAANGGVLQINFGSAFLTDTARRASMERWRRIEEYAGERGLDSDAPEVREFVRDYDLENPLELATIDDVVAHIEHVIDLVGIDHVGIGSDYDGVGDTLPIGLEDVSKFPNLVAALLERGYPEEEIAQVLGGNLMRVWKAVESAAAAAS